MDPYGYGSYGDGFSVIAFLFVVIPMTIFAIAWYVIVALGLQQIFKKYNYPRPWAAWIPIYNSWVLLEVGKQPAWYSLAPLLAFIPFVGWLGGILYLIVYIFATINVNKAFGKEPGGWTVFAVLLSGIWMLVLGFGKSQPNPALANGPYFPPTQTGNAI